jgi:hypothetical protein
MCHQTVTIGKVGILPCPAAAHGELQVYASLSSELRVGDAYWAGFRKNPPGQCKFTAANGRQS